MIYFERAAVKYGRQEWLYTEHGTTSLEYGTWNKWSEMVKHGNPEQVNGKIRNTINMKARGIFNFVEMATNKNVMVEAQYWVSDL